MKQAILVSVLVLALALPAALGGNIHHQRGLELRGGMALYLMMDDPTDWAQQFYGSTSEDMNLAPKFGLSILYKSHRNFVWNIGYNHLFTAKTAFGGGLYEEVMDANEIFVVPAFIFWPEERLNFSLGAGPALMMASLDRNSPMAGSLGEFYGASGRNIGILALANVEFGLSESLALKAGGGFRSVIVDDIEFTQFAGGTEYNYQVMWTTDTAGNESTRSYELDFTGLFIEFGLRWYFIPKGKF